MNEEERKAIKDFRYTLDNPDTKFWIGTNGIKNIDIILKLIEKLQKENEELENDNKYLREREIYLEKRREDIINLFQNQETNTTIPKQK